MFSSEYRFSTLFVRGGSGVDYLKCVAFDLGLVKNEENIKENKIKCRRIAIAFGNATTKEQNVCSHKNKCNVHSDTIDVS